MYKLNTIVYGSSCAPFFVLCTNNQQLLDEKDNFPNALKAAWEHMYVDDFLGESSSVDFVQALVTELQNLFVSRGFNLRKLLLTPEWTLKTETTSKLMNKNLLKWRQLL